MSLPSNDDLTPPLRFGRFEFDAVAFRLRREGTVVPVEPKAIALLQLLLARAPRVVDKADIFAEVWKDVAVTDNALTRVVTQLRKALEDDPRSPTFIETVATRGYRWIAAVETGSLESWTPQAAAVPVMNAPAPPQAAVVAPWPLRPTFVVAGIAALVLSVVLTSSLWRGRRDFPAATTLAALRPLQMSSGTGYDGYLAFSPDGNSAAFSSDRSGALEIYVQGTTPGSAVVALTTNGRQNVQPAWSPDGQFIAYHEMAGNGIWVMPSRGGAARKVSDVGSRPSWSPDGRRIAFQALPVTHLNTLGVPGVLGTISVVDASGASPPVPLTNAGVPEGPHLSPAWLDDRHVVFAAGQEIDGRITLWSTDVPATAPPRLVATHDRLGFDFVLSPDRQRVLFVGRMTNAIWTMRLPGSGDVGRIAEPTGLPSVGAFIGGLTMTGDGRRIGWTSMEMTGHVWARDGDAPSQTPAIRALTEGPGIRYTNPLPASDGRLLLNGARPGAGFSMYMLEGAADPRPLTPHPPGHGGSQWLPGEREVIAMTDHGDGRGVFALDPATGRERRLFGMADLPRPPGDSQPSTAAAPANLVFSRDFDRVAMSFVQDGRPNLWIAGLRDMKPDGTLVRLTSEPEGASYPTWSPDDRWLAYQCGAGTDTHVCVADVATGARTQLTNEPGQSWVGGWGADSDAIFFAARRNAVWNIAVVSRSTGAVRQLTSFADATSYVRYPKWDDRNHRVLFERSQAVARTWSVSLPEP